MPTGGSDSKRSPRARHAAQRVADAVERLEQIGCAEHARIVIVIDVRKVTLFVEGLSFGASLIQEQIQDGGAGVE